MKGYYVGVWVLLLAGMTWADPTNELAELYTTAIYPSSDTVHRGDTIIYEISVNPKKAKLTYLTLELNLPNFDYTSNSYLYVDFLADSFYSPFGTSLQGEREFVQTSGSDSSVIRYKFEDHFSIGDMGLNDSIPIIKVTVVVKDIPCPEHVLIPLKMNARLYAHEFDISSPASDHDDSKFLDCFPDIILSLDSRYDTLCQDKNNDHTIDLTNHYNSKFKDAIILDSIDLYVHFPPYLSVLPPSLLIDPVHPETQWKEIEDVDIFDGNDTLSFHQYRVYKLQPNQTVHLAYTSNYQGLDNSYVIKSAYDFDDGFYMTTMIQNVVRIGSYNFDIMFQPPSTTNDTLSCNAYLGLNVLVSNRGLCPVDSLQPIYVTIRDITGTLIDSFWIDDLKSNSSKLFPVDVSGEDFECGATHSLVAEVNPEHVPIEFTYDDNRDTTKFVLGITQLNLRFTHVSVMESDPLKDICGTIRDVDCDRHLASLVVTDQNGRPLKFLADTCWKPPNPNWWPGFGFMTPYSGWSNLPGDSLRMIKESGITNQQKFSVLFVIDQGNQMSTIEMNQQSRLELALEAVNSLIGGNKCADSFGILTFNTNPDYLQPFTDNQQILSSQIRTIQAGRESYLWNALNEAADICATHPGQEWIIVITGGSATDMDLSSTALQYFRYQNTPVSALWIGQTGQFQKLQELSMLSGGYFYRNDNAAYTGSILASLCEMSSSVYQLSYPCPITQQNGDSAYLSGTVTYQGASSYNRLLTSSDTIDYQLCRSACDISLDKYLVSGYLSDTSSGNSIPYVEMKKDGQQEILRYRISLTNSAQLACDDSILVTDTLPDPRYGSVVYMQPPGIYDAQTNTLHWTVPYLDAQQNTSILYDFQIADTLAAELSPQIVNYCGLECEADENGDNNYDQVMLLIKNRLNPPIIRCYTDLVSGDRESYNFYPHQKVIFKALCGDIKIAGSDWILKVYDSSGQEQAVIRSTTNLSPQLTMVGEYTLPSKLDNGQDRDKYRVRIETYNNLFIPEDGSIQRDTTLADEGIFYKLKMPDDLRLDRNQINPLRNERVTFYIDLSLPQDVEIRIYTIAGEVVWQTTANLKDGTNQLTWDGRDNAGEILHPGIYLIHFSGKTISRSKTVQKLMINWK